MKFLFPLAFLVSKLFCGTNAKRLACWRDVMMLDGVGTRAHDGGYPAPASCKWGVASTAAATPTPIVSFDTAMAAAPSATGVTPAADSTPDVDATPTATTTPEEAEAHSTNATEVTTDVTTEEDPASPQNQPVPDTAPSNSEPLSDEISANSVCGDDEDDKDDKDGEDSEDGEDDEGDEDDEDDRDDMSLEFGEAVLPSVMNDAAAFTGDVATSAAGLRGQSALVAVKAVLPSAKNDAAAFTGDLAISATGLRSQSALVAVQDSMLYIFETSCAFAWRKWQDEWIPQVQQVGWAAYCSIDYRTNAYRHVYVVNWVVTVRDPLAISTNIPFGPFPSWETATAPTWIYIYPPPRWAAINALSAAGVVPRTGTQTTNGTIDSSSTVKTIDRTTGHSMDTSSALLLKVTLILAAIAVFWFAGCVCASRRPLRHGGRVLPGQSETLGFWRRLFAVWTLGMVCGGCTIVYMTLIMYTALWAWFGRGTAAGNVAIVVIVVLLTIYAIPLTVHTTGVPINRLSHPVIKLWRDYFDLSCVFDQGDPNSIGLGRRQRRHYGSKASTKITKGKKRRRRRAHKSQTYMLAQIPHGIMPFGALLGIGVLAESLPGMNPIGGVVADALLKAPLLRRLVNWVGVRRASFASILGMFADGFKAVGVVTGGVAEMFYNWRAERIVAPRANFAKIALKGGHHVIIVFVYGVSRTHRVVCGSYALSKKAGFPLLMGYGAFFNLPYREAMKMVISKPIIVEQLDNPGDEDVAKLRRRMEKELSRLYYRHLPDWESRRLHIVRGESSPAELEALEAKASASKPSAFPT